MTEQRWFHRRGTIARDGWEAVVDATIPGWEHTGLRVAELGSGRSAELTDPTVERLIVPLSGSFVVEHDGVETLLLGRASVFDGPTDVLYLPIQNTAVIRGRGRGRVAVAEAPADNAKAWRYISAAQTPVELRGAGRSSRQVHNFGTPEALDADRLIVCEVLTPSENWSSYPPHKHDQYVPGRESKLEEIYYFETARTGACSPAAAGTAFGLFSAYSSPAGEIEISAMVGAGDVALVPFGYHGPAVAAPGYDLYYLNIMAGPDPQRAWLISDDPAHAWVRETWHKQDVDKRLPYDSSEGAH